MYPTDDVADGVRERAGDRVMAAWRRAVAEAKRAGRAATTARDDGVDWPLILFLASTTAAAAAATRWGAGGVGRSSQLSSSSSLSSGEEEDDDDDRPNAIHAARSGYVARPRRLAHSIAVDVVDVDPLPPTPEEREGKG